MPLRLQLKHYRRWIDSSWHQRPLFVFTIDIVKGTGRIIYRHLSEIYCVFIYYPFTNHTSTVIRRNPAGVGREFILTIKWNCEENFSSGADTSLSELSFWIEISNLFTGTVRGIKQLSVDNSFLPGLYFKQLNASERCPINSEFGFFLFVSGFFVGVFFFLWVFFKRKEMKKKCYLFLSVFFLVCVLFMTENNKPLNQYLICLTSSMSDMY